MTDMPHDESSEYYGKMPRRGHWCYWLGDRYIRCPQCGAAINTEAWGITPDNTLSIGALDQSVGCTGPRCNWHEHVRLTGYRHRPAVLPGDPSCAGAFMRAKP